MKKVLLFVLVGVVFLAYISIPNLYQWWRTRPTITTTITVPDAMVAENPIWFDGTNGEPNYQCWIDQMFREGVVTICGNLEGTQKNVQLRRYNGFPLGDAVLLPEGEGNTWADEVSMELLKAHFGELHAAPLPSAPDNRHERFIIKSNADLQLTQAWTIDTTRRLVELYSLDGFSLYGILDGNVGNITAAGYLSEAAVGSDNQVYMLTNPHTMYRVDGDALVLATDTVTWTMGLYHQLEAFEYAPRCTAVPVGRVILAKGHEVPNLYRNEYNDGTVDIKVTTEEGGYFFAPYFQAYLVNNDTFVVFGIEKFYSGDSWTVLPFQADSVDFEVIGELTNEDATIVEEPEGTFIFPSEGNTRSIWGPVDLCHPGSEVIGNVFFAPIGS